MQIIFALQLKSQPSLLYPAEGAHPLRCKSTFRDGSQICDVKLMFQISRAFRALPCVSTGELQSSRSRYPTTIQGRGFIIRVEKVWLGKGESARTRCQAVSAEKGVALQEKSKSAATAASSPVLKRYEDGKGISCLFQAPLGPTFIFGYDVGTMGRPIPPVGTLQAVLFDVDGTLADSDPIHYLAFRKMLAEEGYNGGEPVTEEFFSNNLSGKFNEDIGRFLFPDWEESRQRKWLQDKEALFRKMAADKLEPTTGLEDFVKFVKRKNLKRAAVTNAPRPNAEQMIAAVGLEDFFEFLVIGEECKRGKPFPDPYLKGLELLGIPADKGLVFEDSPAGIKAAVAAGLAVVGVISGNPESDLMNAGAFTAIHGFKDPKLWNALGEPPPA